MERQHLLLDAGVSVCVYTAIRGGEEGCHVQRGRPPEPELGEWAMETKNSAASVDVSDD